MDSNLSRAKAKEKKLLKEKVQSERAAKNKEAFDSIIGDPYSLDENKQEGTYSRFLGLSAISIGRLYEDDTSSGTPNPAKPRVADFLIDVDSVICDTIDEADQKRFMITYIYGDSELNLFTQQERSIVEQRVGAALRKRGIKSADQYFRTIRRSNRA